MALQRHPWYWFYNASEFWLKSSVTWEVLITSQKHLFKLALKTYFQFPKSLKNLKMKNNLLQNLMSFRYFSHNRDSYRSNYRSSHSEVFLRKAVLKISSKFTGEYPCRSVISRKLLRSFIGVTLRHGYSPVNLLHIFRTSSPKTTYGGLLLFIISPILRML